MNHGADIQIFVSNVSGCIILGVKSNPRFVESRNQRDTVLRFQELDDRLRKQAADKTFLTCDDVKKIVQTKNVCSIWKCFT